MFTRRNSEAARIALNKSLAIAEEYGDVANQLQLLSLLHMFHHRIGDFKTTLHYAKRSFAVSETIADPAAIALAHSLLGSSLHHIGDLDGTRVELAAALQRGPGPSGPARSISTLNPTITPVSPWRGPCGYKALGRKGYQGRSPWLVSRARAIKRRAEFEPFVLGRL
jgi:hypothetical protein